MKLFCKHWKEYVEKEKILENNTLKEFLLKNAPENFNRIWKNIHKED